MRPHPRGARSLLFIVPVAFALTIAAGGARAANPPATLPGASAGETPPRLVVEPSRVAPGETFTVHGFALGAQAQLTLLLVGSGDPVYLADVTADAGGDFTLAVNVPPRRRERRDGRRRDRHRRRAGDGPAHNRGWAAGEPGGRRRGDARGRGARQCSSPGDGGRARRRRPGALLLVLATAGGLAYLVLSAARRAR